MAVTSRPKATDNCGRLVLFITVSMVAHGLLLANWVQNNNSLANAPGLAVTLIPSDRSEPLTSENTSHLISEADNPAPTTSDNDRQVTTIAVGSSGSITAPTVDTTAPLSAKHQPDSAGQATRAKTPETSTTPTSVEYSTKPVNLLAQMKERIHEQIHINFVQHFHYPYLAQRRNWQGEVMLGLRVEANGHLSHIHIVKSSGHTVLDQAALDSLRQIAVIPDADHWLQGNSFDTVLPVEYHLIDS